MADIPIKTTIFLSTDGKHTVQVETEDSNATQFALDTAEVLYDQILEKYGTKASQWKEPKPAALPPAEAEWLDGPVEHRAPVSGAPTAPICQNHKVEMSWKPGGVSKSTGKRYSGFWACPVRNDDGSFCNYRPPKG